MGKMFIYLLLMNASFWMINADGTMCNQLFNQDSFFSLDSLKQSRDFTSVITKNDIKYNLYFNFCQYTIKKCATHPDLNQYAFLEEESPKAGVQPKCIRLTSDSKSQFFSHALIDDTKPNKGLKMSLTQGDVVENQPLKNHSIQFKMACEPYQSELINIKDTEWEDSGSMLQIELTTKYSCPLFELSQIWRILAKNQIWLSIIMIAVGLGQCFMGYKLYKPTLFFTGYLLSFFLLIVIMGEFIVGPNTNVLLVYFLLLVAVLLGALVGYVATLLPKVGFLCISGYLGAVISLIFYNVFLCKLSGGSKSVFYVVAVLFFLIFAFLSIKYWKDLVIWATAIGGAYLIVRPFGWWIGNFPNEFQLASLLNVQHITNVPGGYYLYFCLIILVGGFGIFFQYYTDKRQANMTTEEVKNDYNELIQLQEENKP